MRQNFGDVLICNQFVADGCTVPGGNKHIEIAHGVATPAIAAGHDDPAAVAQIRNQCLGFGFGSGKPEAFDSRGLFERGRQFRFDHLAEATQLVNAAGFNRSAQVVQGADPELVVKQLDPLRTKSGQRGHFAELARQLLFQFFQKREAAGLDDVRDLAGKVLADAGKLRKIGFRRQHASHALRQAFDRARGAAIGANPKLVFPFYFQQVGRLIEDRRDFGILDGHRSPHPLS